MSMKEQPSPVAGSKTTAVELTADQTAALDAFHEFLAGKDRCFILRGYAGTGKTFLIGVMTAHLDREKIPYALLAPTGRAARVLSRNTGKPASTIHSHLYSYERLVEYDAQNTRYFVHYGLRTCAQDNTRPILIVDEASMVSDQESEGEFVRFGTGRLLADLMTFARMNDPGQHGRIVFVGDDAQLPPVGMSDSPALNPSHLATEYGQSVREAELTEVVRQAADNPILAAATGIRENIQAGRFNQLSIPAAPPRILQVEGSMAADRWKALYRRELPPPFVCITYTNQVALRLNYTTRAALWGGDGKQPVQPGDFLMIVANSRLTGLRNGDLTMVIKASGNSETRRVNLRQGDKTIPVNLVFRDVTLAFDTPEAGGTQQELMILENVLFGKERDITPEEQRALFIDFKIRHPELRPGSEAFGQALSEDPYYNALRVKFGYAATCYKAQGGEWREAMVMFEHQRMDKDAQRWAYTAVTRAAETLYVVNPPNRTAWDGMFGTAMPQPAAEPPTEPDPVPRCTNTGTGAEGHDAHEEIPLLVMTETIHPEIGAAVPAEGADPFRSNIEEEVPFLTPVHRRFHAAARDKEIRITAVDPRPANYFVRYTLSRGPDTARMQVYINRHDAVTRIQPAGSGSKELFEDAKRLFESSLTGAASPSVEPVFGPNDEHLEQFYRECLKPAIETLHLRITEYKRMPYRERYRMEDAGGNSATIDFLYNARNRFTQHENHTPGGSFDLYNQIITALQSQGGQT